MRDNRVSSFDSSREAMAFHPWSPRAGLRHAALRVALSFSALLTAGLVASGSAAATPPAADPQASTPQAADSSGPAYGPELEGFDYPYPVRTFAFASQRQTMTMAYMDVRPQHPNWRASGVPPISIDAWYARELKTSADGIRRYEQATYYAGSWDTRYDRWVQMLAGLYRGPGKEVVAWNSALLYDMILTQPVFYEFERIQPPTVLMIGDKDTTAIGKDFSPPDVQAKLGHYPELARRAARRIPHATLIEFPELGHAPQIQDPRVFHKTLLDGLASSGTKTD
jgi:pimeloyl-ACP methyl ester carboxylesterase